MINMINVIINGINGKMGRVVKKSITTQSDLNLVAGTGRQDNLTEIIKTTGVDVVIDFTTPHAVFTNTEKIINAGARPVVGTTGLTLEQINILAKQCQAKKIRWNNCSKFLFRSYFNDEIRQRRYPLFSRCRNY